MGQRRSGNHKTNQKSCKLATVKEIENLRNIKGGDKMAAMHAPLLGAPLFRPACPLFRRTPFQVYPFLGMSKILTARYSSNEAKETRHYIMKKVAHGHDLGSGAIPSR
jgi:hypothetical protein